MDTLDFLRFTITAPQGGWLAIAASLPDGTGWRQYWRAWPDDAESACALIQGLVDEKLNVYYSAHLFREKSTEKQYVIETRTLFSDLDMAEPALILVPPSMLVKSSDERYQAYWILEEYLDLATLETLSRRVTYGIPKADHTGWNLGKMMRVPNTLNYKYVPEQRVRVTSHNKRTYYGVDFGVFPLLSETESLAVLVDDEWVKQALQVPAGHANVHTWWDIRSKQLEKGADVHFYVEASDRSRALWRLMTSCYRAGFTRDEVLLTAYHSANNKFQYLRYGGLRELAKDVIRAEREVMQGPTGIRSRINDFRKLTGSVAEKRQRIAEACLHQMQAHGRFIHARGGSLWYILERDGRPVSVTRVSTQLNVLLDTMFGLNPTEPEHNYVVQTLINHTAALPETGETATLSYYDPHTTTLLLHTGSKTILRITRDSIDTVTNGYRDIIFLWNEQAMTPDINAPYDPDDTWHDALFGMSLGNLASDGVTAPQAMALLRAWFVCLLLRSSVVSRPILAIFGQPGSGKSTLFNRVYRLLYGEHRAVSGIGTPQQFDYGMASDPLLVIDNVDTWERWLPDRIARAAGISEITSRKLYTDLDVVRLRLTAFLGITAHNPKFGREDVLDRFIMITLERISGNRRDETKMLQDITDKRDKYWGQIARDVQRVLNEPDAPDHTVAQFRVQDFSKIGQRIANALGFATDFHSAITTMVDQQKGFVLDEDSVLVDIIDKYVKIDRYKNTEWQTPAKLWGLFDLIGGPQGTFGKQYGNSVKLGRKLWAMQDALKQRFTVEWRFDTTAKTKVWRFLPLPDQPVSESNGTEA